MTIVFYKVKNSVGYGRHSFDDCESANEVREKLSKLPEDEVRFYDTEHYGYGAEPAPNLADFEQDYNDEELDGGWWCVVLNEKKEKELDVCGFLTIQASLVRSEFLQAEDFLYFIEKWKTKGMFKQVDTESYRSYTNNGHTRITLIERIMCESIKSKELRIDIQKEFGQLEEAQFCENCGKIMWSGYSWDGKTYCDLPCVINGEDIDETTANNYLKEAEATAGAYYYKEW